MKPRRPLEPDDWEGGGGVGKRFPVTSDVWGVSRVNDKEYEAGNLWTILCTPFGTVEAAPHETLKPKEIIDYLVTLSQSRQSERHWSVWLSNTSGSQSIARASETTSAELGESIGVQSEQLLLDLFQIWLDGISVQKQELSFKPSYRSVTKALNRGLQTEQKLQNIFKQFEDLFKIRYGVQLIGVSEHLVAMASMIHDSDAKTISNFFEELSYTDISVHRVFLSARRENFSKEGRLCVALLRRANKGETRPSPKVIVPENLNWLKNWDVSRLHFQILHESIEGLDPSTILRPVVQLSMILAHALKLFLKNNNLGYLIHLINSNLMSSLLTEAHKAVHVRRLRESRSPDIRRQLKALYVIREDLFKLVNIFKYNPLLQKNDSVSVLKACLEHGLELLAILQEQCSKLKPKKIRNAFRAAHKDQVAANHFAVLQQQTRQRGSMVDETTSTLVILAGGYYPPSEGSFDHNRLATAECRITEARDGSVARRSIRLTDPDKFDFRSKTAGSVEYGEETTLKSFSSTEDCSEGREEVNDGDVDEAMNEYSSSDSDTGVKKTQYLELCETFEHFPGSRQDLLKPILDPIRQALVDRVMEEFWIIFNQNWNSNIKKCAGGSSAFSAGQTGDNRESNGIPSLPNQRKRQRNDDDQPEDNYHNPRVPHGATHSSSGLDPTCNFACPFRKHDARRYNLNSHRVCALSHWETIARVKEHLYRCHRTAPYCKRCWQTFRSQSQLDAHLTVKAADICEAKPGFPPEGITTEHEARLRSRKKTSPDQSGEDRWNDIYRLLFPNEAIPSP